MWETASCVLFSDAMCCSSTKEDKAEVIQPAPLSRCRMMPFGMGLLSPLISAYIYLPQLLVASLTPSGSQN